MTRTWLGFVATWLALSVVVGLLYLIMLAVGA